MKIDHVKIEIIISTPSAYIGRYVSDGYRSPLRTRGFGS